MKDGFPNHLRLSIHESIGEHKVSMSLLNTRTGFTTPWHCSVALLEDGEWVSAPMSELKKDARLELIYEDSRPSFFKERDQEIHAPKISETSARYLHTPKQLNLGDYLNSSPCVTPRPSAYSSPRMTPGRDETPSPTVTLGEC